MRSRLEALLRDVRIANGTPLTAATFSALELDARDEGLKDWRSCAKLSDDALVSLAADLDHALRHEGTELELPRGTSAISEGGGIRIGAELWLMDAGRAGLHPLETMRFDAHGPNLELLRSEIARLTDARAWAALGLPAARSASQRDIRGILCFPPLARAGGAVLQRFAGETGAPRFCAASAGRITAFAESVAADMQVLWERADAVADRVEAVRNAARAYADATPGVTLEAVAIDMQGQHASGKFKLHVHLVAPDESLRPGLVVDHIHWRTDLRKGYDAPAHLRFRLHDLEILKSLGADGRIDEMALGLLSSVPGGRAAMLARLRSETEVAITLGSGAAPCYAILHWQDGVIMAEVTIPGRLSTLGRMVEVKDVSPPPSTIANFTGRRLDDVIGLPFECSSRIARCTQSRNTLRFELEPHFWLIDLATGRLWDDPSTA